jgi:hypothetical protein
MTPNSPNLKIITLDQKSLSRIRKLYKNKRKKKQPRRKMLRMMTLKVSSLPLLVPRKSLIKLKRRNLTTTNLKCLHATSGSSSREKTQTKAKVSK